MGNCTGCNKQTKAKEVQAGNCAGTWPDVISSVRRAIVSLNPKPSCHVEQEVEGASPLFWRGLSQGVVRVMPPKATLP